MKSTPFESLSYQASKKLLSAAVLLLLLLLLLLMMMMTNVGRASWHDADLSNLAGAGGGAVDVPFAYVRSDGINAVVYRGTDSNIHELYLKNGWHDANLSALAGVPGRGGSPVAYVRSDGINAVVYREVGSRGDVHELWLP